MNKSKYYYLAGKCLVMDEKPEFKKEFLKLCNQKSFDWLQFITICSDNLILPSLYLKFRSSDILRFLPEEINEHLSEIHKINKKRNLDILRQLEFVTNILNKENIFPIYLKGTGNLLDEIYCDEGERIIGDIDLLVPENDFIPSIILMLENGFVSAENSTKINIRNEKHYPRIYHQDYIADVEIHRMPVENMNISWFNSEIINSEKKLVKLVNGCYVESDKHKIIQNFIHDHLEHQEIGHYNMQVPLRDAYDLHLLSMRFPLDNVIAEIKYKEKALAYFTFVNHVLGGENNLVDKKNHAFRKLKKKNDLTLDSAIFRWIYPKLQHKYIRRKTYYIVLFVKMFYSKEDRQRILNKLSDKQFYSNGHSKIRRAIIGDKN